MFMYCVNAGTQTDGTDTAGSGTLATVVIGLQRDIFTVCLFEEQRH